MNSTSGCKSRKEQQRISIFKRLKTNLQQFNNDWYHPGASAWKRLCWYLINGLFFINPLQPFSAWKVALLRLFGARVGKGVVIKPGVNIKYPWLLEIGDYTWIGERVWIDNLAKVAIGSHVCISQGAMLLTGNHDYKKPSFDLRIAPIFIEEGAWLGAQSIVCPGVRVASHAVLAVGSTATRNLAAYTVYQGNPAVAIRQRL